jgi:hypothetical protein
VVVASSSISVSASPAARRCSGHQGRHPCTPLTQASEQGWSRNVCHPPQPSFHQLHAGQE